MHAIRDMSDDVTHDQGRSQRCSEGIRLMVEVSADAFADLSTSASLRRPQPLPSDGPSIRVTRSVATDILWGRRSAPPSRAFPRRPGPGAHPRPQRLVGRLHELVATTCARATGSSCAARRRRAGRLSVGSCRRDESPERQPLGLCNAALRRTGGRQPSGSCRDQSASGRSACWLRATGLAPAQPLRRRNSRAILQPFAG